MILGKGFIIRLLTNKKMAAKEVVPYVVNVLLRAEGKE